MYNEIASFIGSFVTTLNEEGVKKFILSLDVTANLWKEGVCYSAQSKNPRFLFDCSINYKKVWFCLNNEARIPQALHSNDWVFLIDHDSEWRSSIQHEIARIWFACRDELRQEVGHLPKVDIFEVNAATSIRPSICFFKKVSFNTHKLGDYKYGVKDFKVLVKE